MEIKGLQKLTLIDYPGKLSCTVFLAGCNFRCPWCYSRELVLSTDIKKQPTISEKDFFNFLQERKDLLDGAVLCGGEPTIHRGLPRLIKKIKKFGYLVKLDTNGSNPKMLKRLITTHLVDYVAMDVKAPLGLKSQISNSALFPHSKSQKYKLKIKNKYGEAVGTEVDLDKIRKSVEIIKNSGAEYEFRTTVVPGIHTKEDIIQIAKDISPAKRYYLQDFRPEKTIDQNLTKIKPYPEEYLLEIQKTIAPFFEICQIR